MEVQSAPMRQLNSYYAKQSNFAKVQVDVGCSTTWGISRCLDTFLLSLHLQFIISFIRDLFVSWYDSLIESETFMRIKQQIKCLESLQKHTLREGLNQAKLV